LHKTNIGQKFACGVFNGNPYAERGIEEIGELGKVVLREILRKQGGRLKNGLALPGQEPVAPVFMVINIQIP
jgi:hypothetical protein